MNQQQDEFLQSIGDEPTPEQAAQLLEMSLEGDTGTPLPDEGSTAPDASTETGDYESQGNEATNDEQTATEEAKAAADGEGENPTLMAKDGKHTIPYEKLTDAREGERQWREKAEAAQRELDELKSQAQERADAGESPTSADENAELAQQAIDEGIDPGIFGDFSEEDIAKGVSKLVEQQVEARLKQQAEQQQAVSETDQHYNAIYAAHPDADSIGESKELDDWIKSQPSHVQLGAQSVLQQGSAQQVIELFNSFKESTGKTQQPNKSLDVKAAAQSAINKAEAPAPASLSDIPGGRPSAASMEEQMAGLEGAELLDRMQDLDPEKIESLLNKLI